MNTASPNHPHGPPDPRWIDDEGRCLLCAYAYHTEAIAKAEELLNRQDAQIKELHAAYENETLSTTLMAKKITELEGCLRTEAMRIENLKSDRDEWRRNFLRKQAKCEDWKRAALASESQRIAAETADGKPDGQAENDLVLAPAGENTQSTKQND